MTLISRSRRILGSSTGKTGKALIMAILFMVQVLRGSVGLSAQAIVTCESSHAVEREKPLEIKIRSFWDDPQKFEGQMVLVRGIYLGWRGKVTHPRISRSDWAVQDPSGAIYVSGLPAVDLDPMQDIGCALEVTGRLKVSPRGVPFIHAEKVVIINGH
jgi:hypothetical protein